MLCGLALVAALLVPVDAFSVSPSLRGAHSVPISRSSSVFACTPAPPSEVKPVAAEAKPIDPQDAIKEMGALMEQIKVLWSEGKTWDAEERTTRRREIVGTYVRVFAPAVAFSGAQLTITLAFFFTSLLVLTASGLGYEQVLSLCKDVPLLGDGLGSIDPTWGNAAIALLVVELAAPILIPLAAFATPPATKALQDKVSST